MGMAAGHGRVSAIASAWMFNFHDDSEIQREVFANIPGADGSWPSTRCIPLMLVWGSLQLSYRVRNWERGAPDRRSTNRQDVRQGAYGRLPVRHLHADPDAGARAPGIMHSLIYFGFIVLLAVTTVLEINHQVPENLKFLNGNVYKAYALIGDLAGARIPAPAW